MRKIIEAPAGLKMLYVNRAAKQLRRDLSTDRNGKPTGVWESLKRCRRAVLDDYCEIMHSSRPRVSA